MKNLFLQLKIFIGILLDPDSYPNLLYGYRYGYGSFKKDIRIGITALGS